MIIGPRAITSPSAAILISAPGAGFPTVPKRKSSGRLNDSTGEVSESP